MTFTVGQRWVSQTEPKLGLGIISEIIDRRVHITYPAAGEARTYAMENAPVSRVIYKTGDIISDHEGQQYRIASVDDSNDLIQYEVVDEAHQTRMFSEVDLNCFVQLTSPLQRLESGHYDRNRAFRLRYATLRHLDRLQQSKVGGLLGSRTDLLPHQLYIADQVSSRHAPRVLLADEVGLGKTIEAGMILHAQRHKDLANRILIVVPESLIHQWLVEMRRRFNMYFSLFDEERFEAIRAEGIDQPFETEQLVLCSLEFITADPSVSEQVLTAEWDMLIVDEAHHLHWSEDDPSPEYQIIDALAQVCNSVLLLTATPEQAGVASHFARLRLLDPHRFHSLAEFLTQEKQYEALSELAKTLRDSPQSNTLSNDLVSQCQNLLGNDCGIDFSATADQIVPDILKALLDRHGTGRILFRNTRESVGGFPKRVLHSEPLVADGVDPKPLWLEQTLTGLEDEKVLVICSSADQALELESFLKLDAAIATTVFHEGMTIVERDRAAAYFADREEGARVLVCSEIGSEGRNFQFAHHLVLYDLPENPDLLEQRIGRLDRIGQHQDIHLHIPFERDSREEGLFYWYHEGLNAFDQSCAAGYAIYEHFASELEAYLAEGDFHSDEAQGFIQRVRTFRDDAMEELHKGRNPLLEMNSCDPDVAQELITQVEEEEQSQALSEYMGIVFSVFGVDLETQSDATAIIRPGDHMLTRSFPHLNDEGCTATYHRLKALSREDIEFLSWEHPMVTDSMEEIVTSELGNAALATMSVKGVQPGTLFLEAVFSINTMAPKDLQLTRFLPLSPQRVVVNLTGKDLSEVLPFDKLNEISSGLKRKMALAVVKEIRVHFATLLGHARDIAEKRLPEQLEQGKAAMTETLDTEINRLQALRKQNPLIRDEEIAHLEEQKAQGLAYMERAGLEVQAMRIIINA